MSTDIIKPTVSHTIEKEEEEGAVSDCVVRTVREGDTVKEREVMTSIPDLYRLFNACDKRWPKPPQGEGWDLEKLLVCVSECEFD